MTEPTAGRSGEAGPTDPAGNGVAGNRTGRPNQEVERYLVAARPGGGPLDSRALARYLGNEPGVRVTGTVGGGEPATRPGTGCPPVLIVEAPADVAAGWAASPQLIVEPDLPLAYNHPNPIASRFAVADPAVAIASTEPEHVTVVVRGTGEKPLPGAAVYLGGGDWPVSGTTDRAGRVTLRLPADGAPTRLWVRPRSGHWPVVVERPNVVAGKDLVVTATPLDASFEGFPARKVVGWACQALRLNQVAPTFRGHGVKIALIDSGVADEHPELAGKITGGVDLLGGDERGWSVDSLGHGTACAGIISAADDGKGIDGVAVDAEVHVVRAMPGGRLSHLLRALEHCIRQRVDIAQISVGTPGTSELVARKIAEAREAGVLCVAAAGNTDAGPVTFPANLPTVLAVGAVGLVGTFPAGSHQPMPVGPDGLFVPEFSAAGPEVDVCAPGCAVISTVPPDGYAPQDGTGIAAAHVTALAALMLAHHDDFRERFTRGPARVERLAYLIRSSSQPVRVPHPGGGAGMPDAQRALTAVDPGYTDWTGAVMSQLRSDLARAGLIPTGPERSG